MKVEYVIKDSANKTKGALVNTGKSKVAIPIENMVRSNMIFENAVVCKNGVIRGKNGSIPVYKTISNVPVRKTKSKRANNNRGNEKKSIILYHGSQNEIVIPKYGLGEDKHNYGRGFYTTQSKELAKEWAVGTAKHSGYLHTYELDLTGLKVFNFNKVSVLSWLAELMSHRPAADSHAYRVKSAKFIEMYKIDISDYDIIYGWRADSSYFNIAKRFVRDEIDYRILDRLIRVGDLDNQICIKSKKAFEQIKVLGKSEAVELKYKELYDYRDNEARANMYKLIESEENKLEYTFDYVIRNYVDLGGCK